MTTTMPPRKRRTSSRTTTGRTSTASRAAKPAQAPPVIGPGERLFVLSVPFAERGVATANGARWDPYHRQTIYLGPALPYGLTPYASPDYSWERYVEDDLNGTVLPTQPSAMTLTPRPHQAEAITRIGDAARRGYRGFLEADDVGLGKTISAYLGAMQVAQQRSARTVLVMCPKGVIPHWRRTIAALGDHGLRVVVINYDQAKKLLSVPDAAAAAKRTRTKNKHIADKGTPLVHWDVVLYDESHRLKNFGVSQRAKAAARIARYAEAATTAPFVIWMSATAGQNPTELGYLAPLFAQLTGATKSDLKDFGQWLADQGFCVTYNDRFAKWDWGLIPDDATPAEVARIEAHKARDLATIRGLLFDDPSAPAIRRLPTDVAGWPEVQRIAHPVELDRDQRRLYEQAWTAFRADMRLFTRGRDPKGGQAARLRFRQKASLIRVPGTVDLILDAVENGHQVAVSVEFLETADAIRDALAAAKIGVAEYSGRNTATREQERIAFQRGHRQVIVFTVTEGISLHQREQLPDGTLATDVPRTAIVHDPRYSGLDSLQIEGRTHRDGQASNIYYAFAAGTVEEHIVRTLVGRVLSTKAMVGDDVSAVRALEAMLDAAAETEPDAAAETGAGPDPAAAVRQVTAPSGGIGRVGHAGVPTMPDESVARDPGPRPRRAPEGTGGSRARARSAPAAGRSRPAAPDATGAMTPEERALRAALSGGKTAVGRRRETPEERAAFDRRLREG